MSTVHSAIVDPYIHVTKGGATAAAGTSYRADGAGSGSWKGPLTLISSGDLTATASSEDFTGLSAYRELIFVLEHLTTTVANISPMLQLYSTSGPAWRTTGYLNTLVSENENVLTDTDGLRIAKAYTTYCTCIARISNFNSATEKTTVVSNGIAHGNSFLSTTALSAGKKGCAYHGSYDTAEAHEGLRFKMSDSSDYSDFYYSLWGIH